MLFQGKVIVRGVSAPVVKSIRVYYVWSTQVILIVDCLDRCKVALCRDNKTATANKPRNYCSFIICHRKIGYFIIYCE